MCFKNNKPPFHCYRTLRICSENYFSAKIRCLRSYFSNYLFNPKLYGIQITQNKLSKIDFDFVEMELHRPVLFTEIEETGLSTLLPTEGIEAVAPNALEVEWKEDFKKKLPVSLYHQVWNLNYSHDSTFGSWMKVAMGLNGKQTQLTLLESRLDTVCLFGSLLGHLQALQSLEKSINLLF